MRKILLLFLIVSSANIFSEPILFNEIKQNSEANRIYENFFENRYSALYGNCHFLPWNLYLLRRENTDSVTAISVAVKVAEECYGVDAEMIPIAARLMGDNKEHWAIYIIPKRIFRNLHHQDTYDRETASLYNNGFLFSSKINQCLDRHCLTAILVIISKENGEVLFIQ
ncbi:MAG: hypothetical protein LBU70_08985 [Chitinispirillales bacterium]|jgi:hypothetical protein|nr:hypothetical protein [Chitinispirillales bacterium]